MSSRVVSYSLRSQSPEFARRQPAAWLRGLGEFGEGGTYGAVVEGAGATLTARMSKPLQTVREFNEAISACRKKGHWQVALALLEDAWLNMTLLTG